MHYGGIFDYDTKRERLEEINQTLASNAAWDDQASLLQLGKERVLLESVLQTIVQIDKALGEADEWLKLAEMDEDPAILLELETSLPQITKEVERLEFQRMFAAPEDPNNAYLDIQSGSGGTEAQDWAEMLLRMYLRWGQAQDFSPQLLECSAGDVAGIRSATIKFSGTYAYGWLKTETGVHRLVRKSPFDSGNRRHTSFASVFVYPEIDDSIAVAINPADLRIDTYRASGAGGQHVNRTDSAIRITHLPTGIVVQCQSDRSQHKNRAQAMNQLQSKLYELELSKRQAAQQALEETKSDIGWGSQIRSYVLDQSRIKDLRTGVEISNTQAVLDGDINKFLEASLKQGVSDE